MEMPNFTYDKIVPFHNNENYTIAIVNGKAGLIDLEGNPITEFIYDINKHENDEFEYAIECSLLDCFDENYCCFKLNGKCGVLNNKGEVVIPFKYEDICFWGNDLFVAKKGELGVINKNNEIILDFIYDDIAFSSSTNRYFIADLNDKSAMFNDKGERVA